MEPIRVLIADDHPVFRDGLRLLLEATPDTECVGEASTGEEAIALAASLQPDVILMDIQMPDVNGIDATRRILAAEPEIGVVVVTMYEDDASLFAALRAGARGYVLKGAARADILRAIRGVASGDAIYGPAIARRLVAFFATPIPVAPPAFPELSQREREVLALIAEGRTNEEIARRLILSPKTVRNNVSAILNKLQVTDRTAAVVRARAAGLGQEPL
jgi:DNA-binding NarL/FixJ family response regulator